MDLGNFSKYNSVPLEGSDAWYAWTSHSAYQRSFLTMQFLDPSRCKGLFGRVFVAPLAQFDHLEDWSRCLKTAMSTIVASCDDASNVKMATTTTCGYGISSSMDDIFAIPGTPFDMDFDMVLSLFDDVVAPFLEVSPMRMSTRGFAPDPLTVPLEPAVDQPKDVDLFCHETIEDEPSWSDRFIDHMTSCIQRAHLKRGPVAKGTFVSRTCKVGRSCRRQVRGRVHTCTDHTVCYPCVLEALSEQMDCMGKWVSMHGHVHATILRDAMCFLCPCHGDSGRQCLKPIPIRTIASLIPLVSSKSWFMDNDGLIIARLRRVVAVFGSKKE